MVEKVDLNAYRGVWVFVEQIAGCAVRVSLELLGKGRELADKLGVDLCAILLGGQVRRLAEELPSYGADRVLFAEDPLLSDYRTEIYADVICGQALERKPEILVVGATPIGRDLTPRLSFRLRAGCTADCTGLDIDPEKRLLVSTRPAFGGNVMATIVCPENRPQMSTVRPGVMPLPQRDENRRGEIIPLDLHIQETDLKVKILESVRVETEGVKIEEAERIIAIGMGCGDIQTVEQIRELGRLMNAQLGATRLAVDAGWITHDHQIGQTGKTVRPELYIGCGVSGAIQHTAGIGDAKIIVAINKNPQSDIFKTADYGIVGEVEKVVPAIIAELKKH